MKLKYHAPNLLISNSITAFSGPRPTSKTKKWKYYLKRTNL